MQLLLSNKGVISTTVLFSKTIVLFLVPFLILFKLHMYIV